jgi:uncharacterized protein (DUF362 family)/Pyruvate/2-oxoacid:ferredoxin oxidoreductase delta subunit
MKPTVAIERCENYDREKVELAVERAIAASGGLADLIKPGMRVLVKINLLNDSPPEKAVVTHPEVTRAVIRQVKALGAVPFVGDAPGIDLPRRALKVFRTSGTQAVCEEEGVEAAPFTNQGYETVTIESNTQLKTLHIARAVRDADAVICVAKAKSHMQAMYSGVIKNFFGVIPQADRKAAHSLPGYIPFSESLVDIFAACRPTFGLIDAIVGMEGTGPADGDPKQLGLILASRDLVALDTVTCACMGFDRIDVQHIPLAGKRGFGESDISRIEIAGPPVSEVRKKFRPPPTSRIPVPAFLGKLAMRLWRVEPLITEKCTACGECAKICPVQVISLERTRAVIDYKGCVGCFCCHELCPFHAITERMSPLVWLWYKSRELVRGKKAVTPGGTT